MIYRKTIYGDLPIEKAFPYREENKIIIKIYFNNQNFNCIKKKQRFSNSFIIDLKKIPKEVTIIEFYYKQKYCKKIKIAEYQIKGVKNENY